MSDSYSCYRFSPSRHRDELAVLGPPLQLLKPWSRSGVGYLPLASGGRIYISLASGSIVALEESTGQEIWTLALPGTYSQTAMTNGAFLLHPRALLVYFGGELMLVDPVSGAITAKHAVPALSLGGAVVDGDLLLCQFETKGHSAWGAFNVESGTLQWQHSGSWENPIATASQGILCVCLERRVLSGIEIASGQVRWRFSLGELGRHKDALGDEQEGDFVGIATGAGDRLVAAVLGHRVLALDIATGERRWVQEVRSRNPFNLTYYPDGKLYVLGSQYLDVLDADTGQIFEEHDCASAFKQAGVAAPFTDLGVSDEYVFAVDFVGWLIALHKTRHTIDWMFRCKSKVTALDAPVVLGNRMYLLDGRGNFYAFEGS
jgi:outer membrane protein assembly factor BamB